MYFLAQNGIICLGLSTSPLCLLSAEELPLLLCPVLHLFFKCTVDKIPNDKGPHCVKLWTRKSECGKIPNDQKFQWQHFQKSMLVGKYTFLWKFKIRNILIFRNKKNWKKLYEKKIICKVPHRSTSSHGGTFF